MQGVCALLVVAGSAFAQSDAARRARGVERATLIAELRDTIGPLLKRAIADGAFPGAYAVVGDSREVLVELGAGHLDWAKSPATTRRTLWDLASLTKVLGTTTAIAQLVERGRIGLDAPVQRYVPDWTGPGKESVTVRHLLTHTSGLPSFKPYDQQTHDRDSLSSLLFATALERTPGERMVYSDIGAFMLGEIVTRVSGERLDRYVWRHILRPLKMNETSFNPPGSRWGRTAPTEFDSTRGGLLRGKVHDERAYYLGGVAAHAGLFSTANDLTHFAMMLLQGGSYFRTPVLRRETVALFTAYADSGKHNRALGWQKAPAAWAGGMMSSRAFGHTGFTGTSLAVDPELDLFIILLSNRVNPTRDNPRITEVRSRLADAVVGIVRRRRGLTTNAGQP
jgi:serine-type D-Ala-D-Ala carboxypeptidase